jgi:hypothetical protein
MVEFQSLELTRFCIISPPIFDAVNSILEQIRAIEPYVEEWKKEKPINKITWKISGIRS